MCATAGILRTTEVWTCENTFLVPYTCECCAMDVAEVGQSKEQCQQHGSPSTTAVSLCPRRALASRCQQVLSSSTGRLFNPFAMWGWKQQRRLVLGTLPLRGTVVSPLLSLDLEGFRRDKAALITRPVAEDMDSCSQAHKSGWVCCSPLRPCCHVCCIYIMLDFISYFGWLKCC